MNRLGFFLGHIQQLPQAVFLIKTFASNKLQSEVLREYQPTMMVSNEVASAIPDEIKAFFQVNQVDVIVFDSVLMDCKVPFIDKIEAAASFEKSCDAAYLWMDVDSCFINPLHISMKVNLPELAINPVDKRNIGDRYGEERSDFWRLLSKHLDMPLESLKTQSPTKTIISKEPIYPYYNAGMIWINAPKALFQETFIALENMLRLPEIIAIITDSMLYKIFIHQVVLTLMIEKLYNGKVTVLPKGVNYPLHLYLEDTAKPVLSELVSLRYDDYFEQNQPPQDLDTYFEEDYQTLKGTWYY